MEVGETSSLLPLLPVWVSRKVHSFVSCLLRLMLEENLGYIISPSCSGSVSVIVTECWRRIPFMLSLHPALGWSQLLSLNVGGESLLYYLSILLWVCLRLCFLHFFQNIPCELLLQDTFSRWVNHFTCCPCM